MPPSLISQVKKTKTIIEKNKNKNYKRRIVKKLK